MKSILYLIIAAILWGLNFHFIKFMLAETSYAEAGVWRYAFAIVAMVIMSLGAAKRWLTSKISIKGAFLVGVIGLFGFNLAVYTGMQYTSALNAALIMSLNPITTIILSSWILKTEAKWYHFMGAAVSFFGVLLLLMQGDLSNLQNFNLNIGDLLVFVGNVVFAFYHIWVKQYKGNTPNMQFTTYTNLLCMIGFLVVAGVTSSDISIDHSSDYWLWTFLLGVIGTSVSFLLWNSGVSDLGASKSGIFMNIVPLATAISSLFFGLEIYIYHLYCGAIIIFGIIVTQIFDHYKGKINSLKTIE
ncbi:DMT family transporter [Croceivirga radicis]|uniref:DMT family transporter n=1 Tax=Croceivirga radicis TaxID=1929488 RepID=UPI0002D77508|nr:DMT family transporter [Croceivirga radicis]